MQSNAKCNRSVSCGGTKHQKYAKLNKNAEEIAMNEKIKPRFINKCNIRSTALHPEGITVMNADKNNKISWIHFETECKDVTLEEPITKKNKCQTYFASAQCIFNLHLLRGGQAYASDVCCRANIPLQTM
jgi:hypothetical protein